jgi:tetratricopeptide (TPR) repeat protein
MTVRSVILAVKNGVFLALWLGAPVALAQGSWAESYQFESLGQYGLAIQALEPIVDADPNHEFAILRSAWLKYLNGDYNASIRDYRRAVELNDQSLEAQLGLTLPLLAQRRWREAAGAAQEVLTVAPWNYYAHLRLMVAEEGLSQWRTLAAHAREVAAHYPSDATLLVYLARAEARQGNAEIALRVFADVLERIPSHEEALAFVARNASR